MFLKTAKGLCALTLLPGLVACASGGGEGGSGGVHWTIGKVNGQLQSPEASAVVEVGDTIVLFSVDGESRSSLTTRYANRFSLNRSSYLQLEPGQHVVSVLYRKDGLETRTPADLSVNVRAGGSYRLFAEKSNDMGYHIQFKFENVAANASKLAAQFKQLKEANNE